MARYKIVSPINPEDPSAGYTVNGEYFSVGETYDIDEQTKAALSTAVVLLASGGNVDSIPKLNGPESIINRKQLEDIEQRLVGDDIEELEPTVIDKEKTDTKR